MNTAVYTNENKNSLIGSIYDLNISSPCDITYIVPSWKKYL